MKGEEAVGAGGLLVEVVGAHLAVREASRVAPDGVVRGIAHVGGEALHVEPRSAVAFPYR